MPTDAQTTETSSTTRTSGDTPDLMATISESYDRLMAGELTEASAALILEVLLPAMFALIMVIVAYFIAKLLSRWVDNSICKRVDETLGKFAGKLVFYTAMLICGITVLQTMGMGVTSFAAVLAAAGFAIGLAFQGTLSNFAAGILLLVFRPFQVGDVVSTGGVTGKVNAIDLFTTTFDTPDNRRLIVPNSSITGATIENISFHAERRVDVVVGVDYSASIDQTRSILTQCAESFSDVMVAGEGRGYQILLSNLGASSVDWTIRLWTKREDFFAVKEALTEEIKLQLDEAGIGIPFPQMELHFANDSSPEIPSDTQGPANESIVSSPDPMVAVAVPHPKMAHRGVRPRTRNDAHRQ